MHFFFSLSLALIDEGFFSQVLKAGFQDYQISRLSSPTPDPPGFRLTFTPTLCFHNYSENNLKLRMKCQRSVANSGSMKRKICTEKKPKKEENARGAHRDFPWTG